MDKRRYMPKLFSEFIAPERKSYEVLVEDKVQFYTLAKGQPGFNSGWIQEVSTVHFVRWDEKKPIEEGYYWCLVHNMWRLVGFKGGLWDRYAEFSWWVDKCMVEFEDDEDVQMAILEAIRENTEALRELKQEIRNHGWTWLQPYTPPSDPNPWVTPDTRPWKWDWGTATIPSGEVRTVSDMDGVRMIYSSSGDYTASKNVQYNLTVGGKLPEDLLTLT